MAHTQGSFLRGERAGQYAQQRGFPHAVKADQRNFLSVTDVEVHIAQNPALLVVGKAHVVDG